MIVLNADNRSVTAGMTSTLLSANILAGVSSAVMVDVTGFAADQFVIIGIWGSENSEIAKVSTVTPATRTIAFSSALAKPHSESSPVTVLKYDQVKFYWTSSAVFSATIPVTGYLSLDPTSFFTSTLDTVHQSGYGWFVFYASVGLYSSSNSNAIPYANFAYSTVKRVADSFYSRLNQQQQRLIPWDDALLWLNEAYSKCRAELNLVNSDYVTSAEYTISVVAGTAEYALPDRFSDLVYVRNATTGNNISPVRMWEIPEWEQYGAGFIGFYVRGNWLGFIPNPQNPFTVTIRYATLPTFLTSYYDTIDLPDDNFWHLVDYMEYRAAGKLGRDGTAAYKSWRDGIDLMKQVEARRGIGQDSIRATRQSWV